MRAQGKSQTVLAWRRQQGQQEEEGVNMDQTPLAAPSSFSGPSSVRSDKRPS